jgi:hypothetical protein
LHVNQLVLYNQFDEHENWHIDVQTEPNLKPMSKGDFVIIEYNNRGKNQAQFAVGEVLATHPKKDILEIWWYGNNNDTILAAQRQGFWQSTFKKWYYRDSPIHKFHPRYTSEITESILSHDHTIAGPFELGPDQNIPIKILISNNKKIPWSLPLETEGLQDLKKDNK